MTENANMHEAFKQCPFITTNNFANIWKEKVNKNKHKLPKFEGNENRTHILKNYIYYYALTLKSPNHKKRYS